MTKVVLPGHGESVRNGENLITGWTDVAQSERGVEEGKAAGRPLAKEGFSFDVAPSARIAPQRRCLCLETAGDRRATCPGLTAKR